MDLHYWGEGEERKEKDTDKINQALKEEVTQGLLQDFSRRSAHKTLGVAPTGGSPFQAMGTHKAPRC